MQVAQKLAQAFKLLGDRVEILDTEAPSSIKLKDDVGRPAALERALEDAACRSQRVLVAFYDGGEAGMVGSLCSALDGVLLVARPGGATEFRLHKLLRQIDPNRRLGVLLID